MVCVSLRFSGLLTVIDRLKNTRDASVYMFVDMYFCYVLARLHEPGKRTSDGADIAVAVNMQKRRGCVHSRSNTDNERSNAVRERDYPRVPLFVVIISLLRAGGPRMSENVLNTSLLTRANQQCAPWLRSTFLCGKYWIR